MRRIAIAPIIAIVLLLALTLTTVEAIPASCPPYIPPYGPPSVPPGLFSCWSCEETEGVSTDSSPPTIQATVSPASESGWVNTNVKVTLHAGDEEGGSGIAAMHYLWNGKQVTITGDDLDLSPDRRTAIHKIALQDDGIHELVCWTVDAAGNESNRTSSTVRIDKIAPTISATSVPTTEGGWGNANVKVTLRAQDQAGGSGIASIEYTLDGGEVVIERAQLRQTYDTFTHKFAVTVEGVHQLTFQTKDLAGNWSGPGSQTIRIDRTPPMIEATRSPAPGEHGWNNQDVIVRFHCSDGLSGIATCTNEQKVSSEGSAQIVMGEAVDRAGNFGKTYVTNINIDRIPPNVLVSPYSPSITSGKTITLTIEASDSGSGIAYVMAEDSTSGRVSLSREGERWSGSLQPSQDGQITIRVTDRAGNVTTRSVSYTVAVAVSAPRADFICSPTSGAPPLTVEFMDRSIGDITSWHWDFGDGSTSSMRHPGHTYQNSGNYQVNLTVQGPGGSNTEEFCCVEVLRRGSVQVTLRWHSTADLDLHVFDPDGCEVYHSNPFCPSGGELDVDANAACESTIQTPVENIVWSESEAPSGTYTVRVEYYERCAGASSRESFELLIEVQGIATTHNGAVSESEPRWETTFAVGGTSPASGVEPEVSLAPLRIAFTSGRDGNDEIYVMNADGSGQTNLTNNLAEDWNPAWSPDGKHIAFQSSREVVTVWEIYVMNADGSGQTRLTYDSGWSPAWSPDGKRIAFVSERDGDEEIYVINTDGSGQTNLTNNLAEDWWPAWSPDGKRIAFASTRTRDGNAEIYVMNADGSGQTNLTNNLAEDWNPAWSPDGKRIAFVSYRGDDEEIYVMNADGSGQRNLTNNPGWDDAPAWSPQ